MNTSDSAAGKETIESFGKVIQLWRQPDRDCRSTFELVVGYWLSFNAPSTCGAVAESFVFRSA